MKFEIDTHNLLGVGKIWETPYGFAVMNSINTLFSRGGSEMEITIKIYEENPPKKDYKEFFDTL